GCDPSFVAGWNSNRSACCAGHSRLDGPRDARHRLGCRPGGSARRGIRSVAASLWCGVALRGMVDTASASPERQDSQPRSFHPWRPAERSEFWLTNAGQRPICRTDCRLVRNFLPKGRLEQRKPEAFRRGVPPSRTRAIPVVLTGNTQISRNYANDAKGTPKTPRMRKPYTLHVLHFTDKTCVLNTLALRSVWKTICESKTRGAG